MPQDFEHTYKQENIPHKEAIRNIGDTQFIVHRDTTSTYMNNDTVTIHAMCNGQGWIHGFSI
jgi:hypothetical protein